MRIFPAESKMKRLVEMNFFLHWNLKESLLVDSAIGKTEIRDHNGIATIIIYGARPLGPSSSLLSTQTGSNDSPGFQAASLKMLSGTERGYSACKADALLLCYDTSLIKIQVQQSRF